MWSLSVDLVFGAKKLAFQINELEINVDNKRILEIKKIKKYIYMYFVPLQL